MRCAEPTDAPARPGPRAVVLLHRRPPSEFRETGRIRTLLRTVAESLLREGDLVGAGSTGPSNIAVEATEDHRAFTRVIPRVIGNGLRPDDIIRTGPKPPVARRKPDGGRIFVNEIRYRASIALEAACDALGAMARVLARRKALVYVSNGYVADGEGDGACERLQAVTRIARRSRVRIFPIDTRVLTGGISLELGVNADAWRQHVVTSQASLRVFASGTSGLARVEPSDLGAWLHGVGGRVRR